MSARPFSWAPAGLLACAVALSACGSASESVTGPSGPKCQVRAVARDASAPASGGTGTLLISANRDCTWAAVSTAAWITITSSTIGQGDGTVAYRVAENTDPVSRRGVVAVNDAQVSITQDAAPCRFTVTPASLSVAAAGGTVSVHVDSHTGCTWSSTAQADWIQVTAGASGNGPGTTMLAVHANSGAARTGTARVAGQTVAITQQSGETPPPNPPPPQPPPPGCTYTVSPANASVPAAGSNGTFALATSSGCPWTATPGASWIAVTSAQSGSGSATIAWAVSANAGPARSGTIGIAGQTFTIAQAGACTYSLDPTGQTFAAAGGSGKITVSTAASCAWTATTNATWITLGQNPSGAGNGSVTYTVAPNSGGARSGNITIGGQTFVVQQAAASVLCSYSISPTSARFGPEGGTGTIAVTTSGVACAWTAASEAGWITLAVTAGIGDGSVGFSVAPFTGGSRTGAVTVAGQIFTVTEGRK